MPIKDLKKRAEYNKNYLKNHYQKNKGYYYTKKRKQILQARQFIIDFKVGKRCTDCGVKYPYYVFDFDHIKDKKYDVAIMASRGMSIEAIKKEIEKCELVCSNCHRVRTQGRL